MRFLLQTKILLLIAGTTIGMAAVILTSLSVVSEREINQTMHQDVRTTGMVYGELIQDMTENLTGQCQLLASQPVFKAVISTGDRATVTDSARDALKQIHADSATITDGHGRLLGATDPVPPGDNRSQAGITQALRGAAWSGIVRRSGKLMMAVTVPIMANNVVWGTFTAYRLIDSHVARDLYGDVGADLAFVDYGRVIGASLVLPAIIRLPAITPAVITEGGVRYYAFYAPLPHTPVQDGLGYVTLLNYDKMLKPYHLLRSRLIAVLVLTLVLTVIAGAWVTRNLTRPLDEVVHAAKLLREGEWPERFTVRRTDEIGVLQSAFNEMTAAMRLSQDRLLALLDTDPLTGLTNHRCFQERVAEECKGSTASGEALSLLLIDIDHFHEFNREYGHAAGDSALKQVAGILQDHQPEMAVTARYAGDKFAVLLPRYTLARAEECAEMFRAAAVSLPHSAKGERPSSLSIGISEFGVSTRHVEGLVLAADLALSRAKQLGRDRVCRFDSVPGADETADPYQLHRFLKDESLMTIQALAAAVDAKDPYTRGHSQSVAQYASELAQYLELPHAEVDLIHITGTLHDVGKIGVPDSILQKPGNLTDEERAVMETHPVLGEVIIRKVPALAGILLGIRHHHERWDGAGYPDRLSGRQIPKIARILTIADSFDAMISDRPYRKGMPVESALAEIIRGAGTQFDTEMASAFVAMIRERGAVVKAA